MRDGLFKVGVAEFEKRCLDPEIATAAEFRRNRPDGLVGGFHPRSVSEHNNPSHLGVWMRPGRGETRRTRTLRKAGDRLLTRAAPICCLNVCNNLRSGDP